MTTWFGRVFVALAMLALLGLAAVRADVADTDRAAIRGIISSQIEAFQRDDGATAYGYASPTIQGLFPSVDQFMAMVRSGYQPVYRPKSVTFGPATETPRGPEQRVFITGPDGRNWVALYSLQKQPDGSWRINGCTLVEDTGESI